MSKTLIFGIALSLVLVSGGLFGAQADGSGGCLSSISPCNWNFSALSPCNWHFPSLCGLNCGTRDLDRASARDMDSSNATCQGAYSMGVTTPIAMGSAGY
jgi:hypothetical protein